MGRAGRARARGRAGLFNLAAIISPDWLLGAVALTVTALAAEGVRTRRAELFVAASALAGAAVTMKLTALALVAPIAQASCSSGPLGTGGAGRPPTCDGGRGVAVES